MTGWVVEDLARTSDHARAWFADLADAHAFAATHPELSVRPALRPDAQGWTDHEIQLLETRLRGEKELLCVARRDREKADDARYHVECELDDARMDLRDVQQETERAERKLAALREQLACTSRELKATTGALTERLVPADGKAPTPAVPARPQALGQAPDPTE